jgi:hypothetical protein
MWEFDQATLSAAGLCGQADFTAGGSLLRKLVAAYGIDDVVAEDRAEPGEALLGG